jgi:hypothetical protein
MDQSQQSAHSATGSQGALVLHLGMPKTGTSVLQRCLSDRAERLGIQYPQSFRNGDGVGHHALPFSLKKEGIDANLVAEFFEFLSEHSREKIVLSSESFTNLVGPKRYRDIAQLWQRSSAILPSCLVMVVRRLDSFTESMYLQSSRFGSYSGSISDYIQSRKNWTNDFFSGLGALKKTCGESLVIVPFIPGFDILEFFDGIIGLSKDGLAANRDELPSTAKFSVKAQSLLLDLERVGQELALPLERRVIIKALIKKKIAFADDVTRYTILDPEVSSALQIAALEAADKYGVMEYANAFRTVEVPQAAPISLGRSLLTDQDIACVQDFLQRQSRQLRRKALKKDRSLAQEK